MPIQPASQFDSFTIVKPKPTRLEIQRKEAADLLLQLSTEDMAVALLTLWELIPKPRIHSKPIPCGFGLNYIANPGLAPDRFYEISHDASPIYLHTRKNLPTFPWAKV